MSFQPLELRWNLQIASITAGTWSWLYSLDPAVWCTATPWTEPMPGDDRGAHSLFGSQALRGLMPAVSDLAAARAARAVGMLPVTSTKAARRRPGRGPVSST